MWAFLLMLIGLVLFVCPLAEIVIGTFGAADDIEHTRKRWWSWYGVGLD